ncbi:MAG: hypothetical protein HQK52_16575 [Oligoflexia bacterium]|nr:hypothetical protein [Oligoflexia bacterium]
MSNKRLLLSCMFSLYFVVSCLGGDPGGSSKVDKRFYASLFRPPTASAGSDQTVIDGDTVTLSGVATVGRKEATYSWTQVSGSAVTLTTSSTDNKTVSFTAIVPPGQQREYIFRFSVDQQSLLVSDEVIITALGKPPPVAAAGNDQSVVEGETVTLSGAQSTASSTTAPLQYSWTQLSGSSVSLSDATAISPTFTAPTGGHYDLSFRLTLTQNGVTVSDDINVSVNGRPQITMGANQNVNETDLVNLSATVTDPESSTMTYSWTQTTGSTVTLNNATTLAPSFTIPNLSASESMSFTLTASDGTSSSSASVTIAVNATNGTPAATLASGSDLAVSEGDSVTLPAITLSDDEGGPFTYYWKQVGGESVSLSSENVASPTFTAPAAPAKRTLIFSFYASDGVASSNKVYLLVYIQKASACLPADEAKTWNNLTNDGGLLVLCNATQLQGVINNIAWGGSFILKNNIDLSGVTLNTGMGIDGNAYSGTFDGNEYIIKNLTANHGLFTKIINGTVKNLGLLNVDISANTFVGGLADWVWWTQTINYVFVTGRVNSSGTDVGGVIGKSPDRMLLSNVLSLVTVTGTTSTGGIAGSSDVSNVSSSIDNVYSYRSITGTSSVGGLVGSLTGAANQTINHSYSLSPITATGSDIGGIAGVMSGNITNSFFAGTIGGGGTNVGGIAGRQTSSLMDSCRIDSAISGITSLYGSRTGGSDAGCLATAISSDLYFSSGNNPLLWSFWSDNHANPWFAETNAYPSLQIEAVP